MTQKNEKNAIQCCSLCVSIYHVVSVSLIERLIMIVLLSTVSNEVQGCRSPEENKP
jgi:hypothetical protein